MGSVASTPHGCSIWPHLLHTMASIPNPWTSLGITEYYSHTIDRRALTHWGHDKMAIQHTAFWNALWRIKMIVFPFKFEFIPESPIENNWALVQIMAWCQTGHYLNQRRHSSVKTINIHGPWWVPSVSTRMVMLTHLPLVPVSVKWVSIGSDNGLSPGRRQTIIWTNAGILLTGPLEINFNEILIKSNTFSFKKMHLKMSSVKWRPFCPGEDELIVCHKPHINSRAV